MQEERHCSSALFVTLTYDNDHVPITSKGYMTVTKEHHRIFFKKLRKLNPHAKLKYYLAAEYGGKTMRPHYHCILFNADASTVHAAWEYGSVHTGSVTGASIGYTLKYISKPQAVPLHKNDDRLPPFANMSKGLGKAYITPAIIGWHNAIPDERLYCTTTDGKKSQCLDITRKKSLMNTRALWPVNLRYTVLSKSNPLMSVPNMKKIRRNMLPLNACINNQFKATNYEVLSNLLSQGRIPCRV